MENTPITSQSSRIQPPPGLKALINHFQNAYPNQSNPLQVTTVLKYWLGGQDPLDYISMYNNDGDPENDIPPHWHYVSFGLSDLHGDGRVHIRDTSEYTNRSGMGFELSFRLLKSEPEKRKSFGKVHHPPTWPANLLQAIARYCFQTGNILCFGDNIPWRKSLDDNCESRLQNILIAQDPQLSTLQTTFGTVEFCQIVGVTNDELEQASRWNGRGVLGYLQQDIQTGGKWWITDINRSLSVFELFPEFLSMLQDDLERQGSDLAGVNGDFTFREMTEYQCSKKEIDSNTLNEKRVLEQDKTDNSDTKLQTHFPHSMSISSSSLHKSCPINFQPHTADTVILDAIEITLAPYAARYLLLAIRDRIRHGRHFTFKAQHLALTLVAESVTGAIVNKSTPYGVIGYWIQVLISDELVPRMIEAFECLEIDGNPECIKRQEMHWPDVKLKLIVDDPQKLTSSLSVL